MTSVREERSPGVSILHISGPLRVPLDLELQWTVHGILRRGTRRIELNLAAVSDLDAGGVGELIHLFNMAAAAHSELRIANARPRVRALLDRARVFDLLTADAPRWWPQAV
jgi:ABC-type transporter Mla MlaB component